MKTKVILVAGLLVFVVALGTWWLLYVASCLERRECEIKDALRAANTNIAFSASNAKDGVERFVRTGELILEPTDLLNPNAMRHRQMYKMRVCPRVSNDRADGWVGIYNGNWYVKIFSAVFDHEDGRHNEFSAWERRN